MTAIETSSPSASSPSPPATRRRQARATATRTALLDAALQEFAAHGFEGASTRTIAAAAGTHQPQINYHFDSKEELWKAAVDHLFDRLDHAVSDHLGETDPGLAQPGRIRRQRPRVRASRGRPARTQPHHGAGGDDRLRAPAVDRRAPHTPPIRGRHRAVASAPRRRCRGRHRRGGGLLLARRGSVARLRECARGAAPRPRHAHRFLHRGARRRPRHACSSALPSWWTR